MKRNGTQPEGVILVGVLWTLVLLTIIVTIASQMTYVDTHISMAAGDRIRCKWAARAGLEKTIALLENEDLSSDSLYDVWSGYVPDINDIVLDGVRFAVAVTDEAGKLNINTATREQLLWLPDMTEEIADSILDWRDSDDDGRALGAEGSYYVNLPYGYQARNESIRTIRELLMIKGVTEAHVYGTGQGVEAISDYNEGWIKYLTCYSYDTNTDADGNPRIDINRAGENQLQQDLGLSAGQARWIVENRQYSNIGDLLTKALSGGTGSQSGSGNNTNSNPQQSEPITADQFYEIADKITTTRGSGRVRGRVNINTAPLRVLAALLGGDEQAAMDIMALRENMGGGLTSLADLKNIDIISSDTTNDFINYVTTRSSVYTLDIVATADRSAMTYTVEAVVDRGRSPTEILYFREGAIH
ncbi:MAG: general secretion pathway protein GspK [Sedimentisphaerales bacterium]|nr:general secretion pathway protein GspK [Sedimentisphaerales bacterium]